MEIVNKIKKLKKEKDFAIIAHNYCTPEILDIADVCGDSLKLARLAFEIENKNILFAGVNFMAETMKILNPNKRIYTVAKDALCPMAATLSTKKLQEYKNKYPNVPIVLYINSTTECKELADFICTSANAIEIVSKINSNTILFGPDKNLGFYVAKQTGKKLIFVPGDSGFCYVHNNFTENDFLKHKYDDCKFILHPECPKELWKYADYIGSTGDMMKIPANDKAKNFIIGTETGMLHRLKMKYTDRNFITLAENGICSNMKKNGLNELYYELINQNNEIILENSVIANAKKPIINMLNLMKK